MIGRKELALHGAPLEITVTTELERSARVCQCLLQPRHDFVAQADSGLQKMIELQMQRKKQCLDAHLSNSAFRARARKVCARRGNLALVTVTHGERNDDPADEAHVVGALEATYAGCQSPWLARLRLRERKLGGVEALLRRVSREIRVVVHALGDGLERLEHGQCREIAGDGLEVGLGLTPLRAELMIGRFELVRVIFLDELGTDELRFRTQ